MNEELQSRLTKYLDYLESAASTGADAVSAATPVVCQEILLWNAVFPFIFVVPILALSVLAQRAKSQFEEHLKKRSANGGGWCSSDDAEQGFRDFLALILRIAFATSLFVAICFSARSYLTPHLVIIDAVKSVIQK